MTARTEGQKIGRTTLQHQEHHPKQEQVEPGRVAAFLGCWLPGPGSEARKSMTSLRVGAVLRLSLIDHSSINL